MPIIVVLLFLVMLIAPLKYDMSDVKVYYYDEETINSMWRATGGEGRVGAFAFKVGDEYYIIFPHNPSNALIRHEWRHIIDWKNEKRLMDN